MIFSRFCAKAASSLLALAMWLALSELCSVLVKISSTPKAAWSHRVETQATLLNTLLLQRSLFTGCCSGSAGRHFGHLVALIVRQSAENWHPFYRCFPLNLDLTASFSTAKFCKLSVRKLRSPNEAFDWTQKKRIDAFFIGNFVWFGGHSSIK